MNSWHSWSPNSRWLVFSSKVFTPYTQLFLTHIDEEGNDSPPVLISRFISPDRAANIPEFVNIKPNDLMEMHEEFVDYFSFAKKTGQLFDQGRYTESEKYLRKSIELNPDYAETHKNFGYLLTQLRRFDEAEKEWETALQLDPDDPLINLNMGSIYLGRNEYDKAQKSFETSIELDEYCVPAHIGLGIVLLSEGDIDRAHEKFKTAVNINPEYDDAHYRLGIVFLRKKEYVNAEKAFRIAIKLNPNNENAYLGLANVLAMDEKTIPEAISIHNKAMALTSSNVQEHIVLGNIYLKQGDRDSAIKEFDKLLKINPDSPSLRMYVNQLKHQKND